MSRVYPFSDLEGFLQERKIEEVSCILDTQLLVASMYGPHSFNEDAEKIVGVLDKFNVKVYSTVTTRSEYVEVQRRILTTEYLMGLLAEDSKWRITEAVKIELRKRKSWIDSQAKSEGMPVLNDNKIKEIKDIFSFKGHSGKIGWIEFCKELLSGKFEASWEELKDALEIEYIKFRSEALHPMMNKEVKWDGMCKIAENTSLGISDSMLMNLYLNSKISFLASADSDYGYAISADMSTDKVVFVPDNLYRNRFKKLKS